MAAGFDSFLEEQARNENTLLDRIYDLVETELIPRKERAGKTRLKISAIPQYKTLEAFDLSWLKGGLTQEKFNELSTLSFVERKENVFFSVLLESAKLILCRTWVQGLYFWLLCLLYFLS